MRTRWAAVFGMLAGSVLAIIDCAPAVAESAAPADPNRYAEVVSFGAQEDHDLYPGPGNVVGGRRSDVASSGDGVGLSTFVTAIRTAVGSVPTPPGQG